MKIWVSNQDVSDSLGTDVSVLAKQRASTMSPNFHDARVTALCLGEAKSEAEFFETFMRLLRIRHGASTHAFDIPRKPGVFSGITQWLKKGLWKLLRYQHDRMTFQQNLINEMLIHAVEFEMGERQRRIDELEGRLSTTADLRPRRPSGQDVTL